jgi:hypothetical protein
MGTAFCERSNLSTCMVCGSGTANGGSDDWQADITNARTFWGRRVTSGRSLGCCMLQWLLICRDSMSGTSLCASLNIFVTATLHGPGAHPLYNQVQHCSTCTMMRSSNKHI